MEKLFRITGMHCSTCAMRIEKKVNHLDNVQQATVNLATETLYVISNDTTDEQSVAYQVEQAVQDTGYKIAKSEVEIDRQAQLFRLRVMISVIFSIPLFYLAMGSHVFSWPMPHWLHNHFNMGLVQLIISLPIIFVNHTYYTDGFKQLLKRQPNMDSLVAIGTLAAFLQGLVAVVLLASGQHYDIYIESGAIILTLVTVGKYIEHVAKKKTTGAIKALLALTPRKVQKIVNGQLEILPVEMIEVGDVLRVKTGEYVALDGVVVTGKAYLDESVLTGETMAVTKTSGSAIVGGALVQNGSIDYKVTKIGKETTLAQIIELVERAQSSKAPISKLADKVSGIFVPIILVLAILTFMGWLVVEQSITQAVSFMIAVLVIACPCALGLATPTALMVGMGLGAKKGIFIKNAIALEQLHHIDCVVLDKTGTITHGKPVVTDIIGDIDTSLLQMVASVESHSQHPIAQAIVSYDKHDYLPVTDFKVIEGEGVLGIVDGHTVKIGNNRVVPHQMDTVFNEKVAYYSKKGQTPVYVCVDNSVKGIIVIADSIKHSSKQAIALLQKQGIHVVMATGDNEQTAYAIAKNMGISQVYAQVLPADKVTIVEKLQQKGLHGLNGLKVAMVGDGINDAPALSQANVGIAIGSGTQVAVESADVVLVNDDLMDVVRAIKLSKQTMKTVKMNLFWAFAYNVIGIPIAMGLFYPFVLNPMLAGLAMSLSSISVVLNALWLNYKNSEVK